MGEVNEMCGEGGRGGAVVRGGGRRRGIFDSLKKTFKLTPPPSQNMEIRYTFTLQQYHAAATSGFERGTLMGAVALA